jgi:hypothetical protein
MPPRARVRGIPLSPIIVRSVAAPGVGGVVTDSPSWELNPQQLAAGTDAIFPKGVISLRGPYITASASGALISAASGWLTGAIAADLPSFGGAGSQPAWPVLQAAANTGAIGIVAGSPSGSYGTYPSGSGTALLPREVYKGEVLWCPQDGVTPIARTCGAPNGSLTANSASAGTITYYQSSSSIFGLTTNFLTAARVGTYIGVGGFPSNNSRLVVTVNDDTHISVDGVFPVTVGIPGPPTAPPFLSSGQSWGSVAPTRIGVLGLCIPVQTLGQASITTGLYPNVSGFGTLWNTANTPPGHGRPQVGDLIGSKGVYDRVTVIQTITSDTALTISPTPGNDYANRPYIIYRAAMGRECRYHQGRLYITGVAWDNTGVYYMPVNSPLGAFYNPDTSATITSDFATSQCLLKFDVPIQAAPGRNVALLSTPQGLLILRSDNAYLSMGDPPTNTVIELAHGAGCVDVRSACVGNRGEGAFWAGPEGIYRYVGGRVIDLTDGRRNREWRQKMATFLVDNVFGVTNCTVSCGVLDSHLFVAVQDAINGTVNSLWVYDLQDNAWCGDFSGSANIGSMTAYRASSLSSSARDDLYFTNFASMGTGDRSQVYRMGGIARDEGGAGTTSMFGTFSIDLPEAVVGAIDDLSRVIELKIVYELTGGDGTTKLRVQSNVDGSTFGLDVDLPTTSGGPQEARIMPTSDVTAPSAGALGLLGRRHGLRLSQVGTKPSSLRVHAVDFVVRPRRPRA